MFSFLLGLQWMRPTVPYNQRERRLAVAVSELVAGINDVGRKSFRTMLTIATVTVQDYNGESLCCTFLSSQNTHVEDFGFPVRPSLA